MSEQEGAGRADSAGERDEEQWPFYRYPRPLPGQVSREEARERRIRGVVEEALNG